MNEWISKMWSIHTTESDSALKRNKILKHALTWKNPEDRRLSEISQSQKDALGMLSLLGGL